MQDKWQQNPVMFARRHFKQVARGTGITRVVTIACVEVRGRGISSNQKNVSRCIDMQSANLSRLLTFQLQKWRLSSRKVQSFSVAGRHTPQSRHHHQHQCAQLLSTHISTSSISSPQLLILCTSVPPDGLRPYGEAPTRGES
jgi:hypothetical protein